MAHQTLFLDVSFTYMHYNNNGFSLVFLVGSFQSFEGKILPYTFVLRLSSSSRVCVAHVTLRFRNGL